MSHPGGHASGGKSSNVVLKVDASDSDHIHLVRWIVEGANQNKTYVLQK